MKSGSVVPGFLDAGRWSACFGLSFLDLILYDGMTSGRIMREKGTYLRKVAGTGGIVDGRNQVTARFLDQTDGEWLWFVDTDMGFAPETVDRLVASADRYQRPVMGALCFAGKRVEPADFHAERFGIIPTVYALVELDDETGFLPIEHYERDAVQRVAGTGAACVLIHRRVLFKIRKKYGDRWFDPIEHPTGLNGKPRTFSEDLSFCIRCAAVDIPLHVDTSIKTTHEKGGVFFDEGTYDVQQSKASEVKDVEPVS